MDCRTAREWIDLYIDGVIGSAQSEELHAHAASCPACKKELEDALRIKTALEALGQMEPPEGLASGAVRKVRKRKIVPIAYISAAAAAVLALVIIFTSGMLPQLSNGSTGNGSEKVMMGAPEQAEGELFSMDLASAAAEESAADEAAPAEMAPEIMVQEAPRMESPMTAAGAKEEEAGEASDAVADGGVAGAVPAPYCIVYVPQERSTDIRAAVENIITEYGVVYAVAVSDGRESWSFILPAEALQQMTELIAELSADGEITADQMIEFVFGK